VTLLASIDDATTVNLRASFTPTLDLLAGLIMGVSGQAFEMTRGEDKLLDFTLPVGQDVTGMLVIFTLATSAGGTVRVTKTAAVIDETNVTVTLAAADTEGLTPGNYAWDAWTRDGGAYASLASGVLRLRREVAAYP
jgi:hypothetical protein